ncbi:hypothetical protein OB236_22835 [Paenibacillus sp. WQ 127069]|uniref:TraD/TraG TraM recognition site domain-containing protein n=1 Tax=Paenibacillus baimaensis TaxID=2982185 RepID=A0ABT2UK09_9BACL|nr:hypothetical protein [Paenibacillus sp. WQ 127069]MCU6794948.1 hypothetical protein [Paenibacillus sp. WQ 127069]
MIRSCIDAVYHLSFGTDNLQPHAFLLDELVPLGGDLNRPILVMSFLSDLLQDANRKVSAYLITRHVLEKQDAGNQSNSHNQQGIEDQLIREVEGHALLDLHRSCDSFTSL